MNAHPHKNSPHSPLGAFRDQSASETISAPVGAKIDRRFRTKAFSREEYAALSHLTYAQAAEILGCSEHTVYFYAKRYDLPYPQRLKTLAYIATVKRNRMLKAEKASRQIKVATSTDGKRQVPFTAIGASGRERITHVSLPREPWL